MAERRLRYGIEIGLGLNLSALKLAEKKIDAIFDGIAKRGSAKLRSIEKGMFSDPALGAASQRLIKQAQEQALVTERAERNKVASIERASREVARIHAQTARQAEQQEKIQERAAKVLADVRIREGKRSADALIRSLQNETRTQETAERQKSRVLERATREQVRLARDGLRQQERSERDALRAFEQYQNQRTRAALGASREQTKAAQQAASVESSGRGGGLGGIGGGILGGALSFAGGGLLTSAISGVGGAVKNELASGIEFLDLLERSEIGLTTILKNGEKAKTLLAELVELGTRSPFRTAELIEYSQQLIAFKFNAQDVPKILTTIGDTAAGLGKGADTIGRILNQLGQIRLKGKVNAEELVTLAENGINAFDYLATALSKVNDEYARMSQGDRLRAVRKLGEQGRLDSENVIKVILQGLGTDFGGMMKKVEGTFSAMQSTFQDLRQRRAAEALGGDSGGFALTKGAYALGIKTLDSPQAEAFTQGVAGASSSLFSTLNDSIQSVTGGRFAELGAGAANSFVGGVNSTVEAARSAGAAVGGAAEQGVRDALDMRSPSRVMQELGIAAAHSFKDGFSSGMSERKKNTIKKWTDEQLKNARTIYEVGMNLGASEKQMRAAMSAAVVESRVRNLNYGDRDSLGIMQQRPSQGWGSPQQVQNVAYAAMKFFEAAMNTSQGGTVGNLAQRVQRSAFPGRYDQELGRADALLAQVRGDLNVLPAHIRPRGGDNGRPDPRLPASGRMAADGRMYMFDPTRDLAPYQMERAPRSYNFHKGARSLLADDYLGTLPGGRALPVEVVNFNNFGKGRGLAMEIDERVEQIKVPVNDKGGNIIGFDSYDLEDYLELEAALDQAFGSGLQAKITQSLHVSELAAESLNEALTMGDALRATNQLTDNLTSVGDAARKGVAQIDALTILPKVQKEGAEVSRIFENIKQIGSNAIDDLLNGDFAGLWSGIKSGAKAAFAQIVKDTLSSGLGDIFGGGGKGGGIINSLIGGVKKLFTGGGTRSGSSGGVADYLTPGFGGGASPAAGFNVLGGGSKTAEAARQLGFDVGGGIQAPQSLTQQVTSAALTRATDSSKPSGAGGLLSSLFGKNAFSGIGFGKTPGSGGALAGLAPLLGLQLGAGLGGGGLGSIIGGAGGALLGIGLTAAPAGLAAIAAGGGAFAGLAGGAAALFSNPLTAIAGGALLLGAYFIGRSTKRRKEETLRTQIINDSFARLDEILRQVKNDRLDGASAISQAQAIKIEYVNQINSQLKDKKTKRIALEQVRDIDTRINAIITAANSQDARVKVAAKLIPTFATGGDVGRAFVLMNTSRAALGFADSGLSGFVSSQTARFNGRVPGVYNRLDDKLIAVSGDETVVTPAQRAFLGGHAAMRAAGVPGYANGTAQTSGALPVVSVGSVAQGPIEITVETLEIHIGEGDATKIFMKGAKTRDGRQVVINTMRTHVQESGRSGLVGDLLMKSRRS